MVKTEISSSEKPHYLSPVEWEIFVYPGARQCLGLPGGRDSPSHCQVSHLLIVIQSGFKKSTSGNLG